MKTPALIRSVDELGRIVIPIEFRRLMEIEGGQEMELTYQDGALVLRKFAPGCVFCGSRADLMNYAGKEICGRCLQNLTRKR